MKLTTIWTIPAMSLRERLDRTRQWAWREIAHRLPRSLAYWSLIDTGARHMRNDIVPEVTFVTVLERASKGVER
jgi:hypothetical protein